MLVVACTVLNCIFYCLETLPAWSINLKITAFSHRNMVEVSEYEYRSGLKNVIINLDGFFILTVFTNHNNRCYGKTAKYLATYQICLILRKYHNTD